MDTSIFRNLRINGQWSAEARIVYTARRWQAFFKRYPELIPIALSKAPDNRVLWDAFFRFFFRRFPERTDTYREDGKEKQRMWYYNEEVFDPCWDRLLREYHAGKVYRDVIRPYLEHLQCAEESTAKQTVHLHLVPNSEAA